MSQVDRFSARDFAPARPSCSPPVFGTSPFLPGLALWPRRSGSQGQLSARAEASQAEFLVTGDRGLLSLEQHRSIRIITPAAMIEILKKAESGK
jgi:hypothetical protein